MNNHYNKENTNLNSQFIRSMKVLFELLDDRKTGFVSVKDIESNWLYPESCIHSDYQTLQEVLHNLKDLAVPNDSLSFETFILAMKLVLVEGKASKIPVKNNLCSSDINSDQFSDFSAQNLTNSRTNCVAQGSYLTNSSNRCVAHNSYLTTGYSPAKSCFNDRSVNHYNITDFTISPSNDAESSVLLEQPLNNPASMRNNLQEKTYNKPTTAMVRPYKYYNQNNSNKNNSNSNESQNSSASKSMLSHSLHESKLTMLNYKDSVNSEARVPTVPLRHTSNFIASDLRRWQSDQTIKSNQISLDNRISDNHSRSHNSGNVGSCERLTAAEKLPHSDTSRHKPRVLRRDSGRRHSISSGIDGSMLKRMRQLQNEKTILLKGLDGVERGREWYQEQIEYIESRLQNIGNTIHTDNSLDANEERMHFLASCVDSINQHVKVLINSSAKGFPIHMNLSMRPPAAQLPDEYHKLREILFEKDADISRLEREKSSLIQQLFRVKCTIDNKSKAFV